MKVLNWGIAALAMLTFLGAAHQDSGYSEVQERKALVEQGGEGTAVSIRDKNVRPEEVYKYGTQEFGLIVSDTGYFPARIIVRRNIPVRIFLASSSAQSMCFVMDEFSIRKGVGPQAVEEIRILPTKVGQYRFYCPVKEVQGTLVVRD